MIRGKGVLNPQYRQRTAYHAMILGGMALFTSTLIVIVDKQTKPEIELRRAEDIKNSLSSVIPPAIHTNDLLKDTLQVKSNNETKQVYLAKSYDKIVAVAFEMSSKGYAGPITVILGVNRNGELLGTRVLSHNETPGLGDKIESEKSSWIFTFDGMSLSNPGEDKWSVKKDGGYFDQFTGATITPRAVIKAVKTGLEFFQMNKPTLLATAKPKEFKNTPQAPSKPDNPDTVKPDIVKPKNAQANIQESDTQRGTTHG